MRRRVVEWRWDEPEAQAVFAEWVGFPTQAETGLEVDRIEALAGRAPPARVLDVGCGQGRQTLELARRGYAVVGIDVAASFLAEARAAAQREWLAVELRLLPAADLTDADAYDLVLAFNHTLGFLAHGELVAHLTRLRIAVKPAGLLLLKLAGPRVPPGHPRQESRSWAERDGRFILSHHVVEDGYRTETSILIDTHQGEIVEFRERQRALTLAEVEAALSGAGFRQVASFADLAQSPATDRQFGVFLCRKD
jgi:D-alanine-D-alanine ligase